MRPGDMLQVPEREVKIGITDLTVISYLTRQVRKARRDENRLFKSGLTM